MNIISFNCRGFASQPKKIALRRLLTSSQTDIIFLQETLCLVDPLIHTLNSWLPNWTFHALDAFGRSGGSAIGICNKALEIRNIWGGRGFIGMDTFAHPLKMEIRIMNVYGPCVDRANFWRTFPDFGLIQVDNIILGGDLNFSLGFSESWGHSAQVDSLSDTISSLLEEHQWVDITSARIQYTWTNNRSGDHSLSRRIDKFPIKEAFLSNLPRIRQWVGTGGISDHHPIFMELADVNQKIRSPFKFNASWLKDPSYIQMVTNFWQTNPILDNEDHAEWFIRKLTELKRVSKIWAHQKHINDENFLREAESAIAAHEDISYGTFPTVESKELYTSHIKKRS